MDYLPRIKKRKFNYDNVWFGAVLGFFAPLITLFGYYLFQFHGMRLASFIHYLESGEIFIPLISLCNFANLGLFYLFYHYHKDKSARGVIGATFLYAFFVMLVKFRE
jgi:hypothetical protein